MDLSDRFVTVKSGNTVLTGIIVESDHPEQLVLEDVNGQPFKIDQYDVDHIEFKDETDDEITFRNEYGMNLYNRRLNDLIQPIKSNLQRLIKDVNDKGAPVEMQEAIEDFTKKLNEIKVAP